MTESASRPSTLDDLRERAPQGDPSRTVHPAVPLILLKTIRDMDLPPEFLEEENVAASMPRRFGLSDVVASQIQRFEASVKSKELHTPDTVIDLIKLVIRRPDAEEVCDEAGRRVAHHFWGRRMGVTRFALRWTPRILSVRIGYRRVASTLSEIVGDGEVSVARKLSRVTIANSLTARADPGGAACAFYGGFVSEVLRLHINRDYRTRHTRCAARGDDLCQWDVVVAS